VSQTDSLGLPYTTLSYANGPGFTRDPVSGTGIRKVFNPVTEATSPSTYAGTKPRPDLSAVNTSDPLYMQEATVPMASETHAGEEVAIYAEGPHAYLFRGTLEQNVIYHVMADALGM